jgi:hypothetical protein
MKAVGMEWVGVECAGTDASPRTLLEYPRANRLNGSDCTHPKGCMKYGAVFISTQSAAGVLQGG